MITSFFLICKHYNFWQMQFLTPLASINVDNQLYRTITKFSPARHTCRSASTDVTIT